MNLSAAITELESMPRHGEDIDGYQFDESEFSDWYAYLVRTALIEAGAWMAQPPAAHIGKADCLFILKSLANSKAEAAEFLTVEQAAERLQVSKDSVYDLVRNGLLDAIKVGRTIRIKPAALEQIHQDDGW